MGLDTGGVKETWTRSRNRLRADGLGEGFRSRASYSPTLLPCNDGARGILGGKANKIRSSGNKWTDYQVCVALCVYTSQCRSCACLPRQVALDCLPDASIVQRSRRILCAGLFVWGFFSPRNKNQKKNCSVFDHRLRVLTASGKRL